MYNKTILIGNLTRDVELKYLPNGTPVANFTLAVNSKYGGKDEILFMLCTVFGKIGEGCNQYLGKGKKALVEGRLQEQKWEKDGEKKSKMILIADKVVFLSNKESSSAEKASEETTDLEPF